MNRSYVLRKSGAEGSIYRTTPLRGVWQHPPYFHDGSAATLREVVDHYDTLLELELTEAQKSYLIDYLSSL